MRAPPRCLLSAPRAAPRERARPFPAIFMSCSRTVRDEEEFHQLADLYDDGDAPADTRKRRAAVRRRELRAANHAALWRFARCFVRSRRCADAARVMAPFRAASRRARTPARGQAAETHPDRLQP